MLKIYTDSNYLTETHRRNIFPLLLDLCFKNNERLLSKYKIVQTLDEADLAVVPVGISYYYRTRKSAELYNFINKANAARKRVWLFSDGDFGKTIDKNVYVFRLGGFNSKLSDKTFIVPSFIQDPYKTLNTEFFSIPKNTLPSVGFVGNADGSFLKLVKEALIFSKQTLQRIVGLRSDDHQSFYPSSIIRYRLLSKLAVDNRVQTNFILRKKYRAGAKTDQDRQQTQNEFLLNIANNPYTFCMRGSGNFSVRFFEVLAMGRIPLLIDTDIRLPLDGIIDWKQHCVIASKDNFVDALAAFHNQIDPAAFEAMQTNNRNLWLTSLTREKYFLEMQRLFTEAI